ncbi:MAG: FAD-binding protein [Opitutaceae bacterium]|nr:FAD-binding protein [Opitutaceae bacterium]
MSIALEPTTTAELVDAVRSAPRVIAIGGGTKPRLSRVGDGFTRISTAKLNGIVEYEPSEFTFTAQAGTPLRDIVKALAERGQYLPFDPMLVRAGSTLGGAVAGGLSGSGRFRFGGLRDFILGIRFVDGEGRLLRLGGKVVKNAAGFDLPKFFIGSAGRFGVLAELSFKVFPRPAASRTLRLEAADFGAKVKLFAALANSRWEIDALDAPLEEPAVYARIGGPATALDALAAEILGRMRGMVLTSGEADFFWLTVSELRWAHSTGVLAKFALVPTAVEAFAARVRACTGARGWISAGGNVGYVSTPAGTPLPDFGTVGVTLRGDAPLWLGPRTRFEVMNKVKAALDPQNRFPDLDERE